MSENTQKLAMRETDYTTLADELDTVVSVIEFPKDDARVKRAVAALREASATQARVNRALEHCIQFMSSSEYGDALEAIRELLTEPRS